MAGDGAGSGVDPGAGVAGNVYGGGVTRFPLLRCLLLLVFALGAVCGCSAASTLVGAAGLEFGASGGDDPPDEVSTPRSDARDGLPPGSLETSELDDDDDDNASPLTWAPSISAGWRCAARTALDRNAAAEFREHKLSVERPPNVLSPT